MLTQKSRLVVAAFLVLQLSLPAGIARADVSSSGDDPYVADMRRTRTGRSVDYHERARRSSRVDSADIDFKRKERDREMRERNNQETESFRAKRKALNERIETVRTLRNIVIVGGGAVLVGGVVTALAWPVAVLGMQPEGLVDRAKCDAGIAPCTGENAGTNGPEATNRKNAGKPEETYPTYVDPSECPNKSNRAS